MNDIFPALNAPRRREILRFVWGRERSAGEIHRANPDITFGAVSQHLRVLEQAGLIGSRREGLHHYYQARPEQFGSLREWLESMWDSSLYRLKIRAEMEQNRRGPRPKRKKRRKK
jgi:DNA-binding transcriptional ArsR family regulator